MTAPSPKLEVDSTGLDPMAEMLLSSTEKLAWNGLGIGLAFVVMMGLYADPVQAHDAIADPSQMAPNELWSMAEGVRIFLPCDLYDGMRSARFHSKSVKDWILWRAIVHTSGQLS